MFIGMNDILYKKNVVHAVWSVVCLELLQLFETKFIILDESLKVATLINFNVQKYDFESANC